MCQTPLPLRHTVQYVQKLLHYVHTTYRNYRAKLLLTDTSMCLASYTSAVERTLLAFAAERRAARRPRRPPLSMDIR